MRPLQKRNFIAYYIEIKMKHAKSDHRVNFSLSDMVQKISQFRYAENGHNFEQYEKEIINYYKFILEDIENDFESDELTVLNYYDNEAEELYKEELIQRNII